MRSTFVLVALLGACASPSTFTPTTGVAKGPDLGSFISRDDLAVASVDLATATDLASSTHDLAMTPKDLAMSIADLATKPGDMSTSSGCGSVTYAGYCTGNTLTYCYQNQVQTLKCTGGTQCTTVSGDSDCRYVNGSPCGTVDDNGLCAGDTLVYCDNTSNTLVVQDCTALGYQCDTLSGFADCD